MIRNTSDHNSFPNIFSICTKCNFAVANYSCQQIKKKKKAEGYFTILNACQILDRGYKATLRFYATVKKAHFARVNAGKQNYVDLTHT